MWALSGGSYSIGDKVENASLKSLAGGSVRLSHFKGKVIVLNFFASW
jgi:peroxiredoxin